MPVNARPAQRRANASTSRPQRVTAVTTSRIARKQGFARVMTARQLAEAAENGAEVAALGMFDQGFYDQVGFGTGGYEHSIRFDPARILTARSVRVARTITFATTSASICI